MRKPVIPDVLTISMNIGNAAFEGDDLAPSIAWSLRNLADRIEAQNRAYLSSNGNRTHVIDTNGNVIGFCNIEL